MNKKTTKNITLFLIFFLGIGVIIGGIFIVLYLYNTHRIQENQENISESGSQENISQEEEKILTDKEKVEQRIIMIKKRLGLKQYIISGDSYFGQGETEKALAQYLEYYKQNPKDPLILDKIADTYFSVRKFTAANTYYNKTEEITEKRVLSAMYVLNFEDSEDIKTAKNYISELNLPEQENFYFTNSLFCLEDFHTCKINFQNYFDTVASESGSILKYEPLKNIEQAMINYENFQLDDVSLKNAYIIAAWYTDGFYPLAITLSKRELETKKDYRPLLKIIAQSYFELGKYDSAKAYLSTLNSLQDNDPAVSYMLGYIASMQQDYTLANIHLQKAIDLQYDKSIEAKRILIHNLYVTDNTPGMLSGLQELIENFDYNESDASIALYENILAGNMEWAGNNITNIMTKFPENVNFYAYKAWIQRENGDLSEAKRTLLEGNRISSNNAFILLNLAYTEKELGNSTGAKIYFHKVLSAQDNEEFINIAREELKNLEQ